MKKILFILIMKSSQKNNPKINFLCVGVQKSGTTSLIKYLNLHNDIYIEKHEKHFFDIPLCEKYDENEIEKYEKSFDTDKKIVGEKTPSYCHLYYSLDRIYKYNPNMKIIVILREPISRVFSQYNMELNRKKHVLNFHDEIFEDYKINNCLTKLTQNGCNYIIRGFYDEQIKYIKNKFKNVLILISEEIKENKEKEYNKIFDFLEIQRIKINLNLDTHVGHYSNPICEIAEKKLYEIYKEHNLKLYELLGRKISIWENYYQKFKNF